MKQATTQRQQLDALVGAGRLSAAEADELANAPRTELSIREVVIYLASVIISVGVIRLIVAVFENASKMAIASAIYVAAIALTAFAIWLNRGSTMRQRFGEVCEFASTGGFAIATGILLVEWDVSNKAAVMWPALGALAWGLYRCRTTNFVGTLILPPAMLASTIAFASLINVRGEYIEVFPMVGAMFLIALSITNVHSAVLLRLAGAVILLSTVPSFVGTHSDEPLSILGLAIAVTTFAVAANRMWPELLISGALQIVISVAIIVFTNVDNDVAQGLIVVAVGGAVLAVTSGIMRGRKHGDQAPRHHRHVAVADSRD